MGAAADSLQAVSLFPALCAVLFGVYAFSSFAMAPFDMPEGTATNGEILTGSAFLVVMLLVLLAVGIPLTRFFAGGTPTALFARPFFRVLGWFAAFILAGGAFMLLFVGVLLLAVTATGTGSEAGLSLMYFLSAVLLIPCLWLALRLTTLWPSLALDEPAPLLRRSFGETKGYVWYFLLTGICSLAIFIPLGIAVALAEYLLVGLPDATGVLPPSGPAGKLGLAAVSGVSGLFYMVYSCALYGRFFRAVRGLD